MEFFMCCVYVSTTEKYREIEEKSKLYGNLSVVKTFLSCCLDTTNTSVNDICATVKSRLIPAGAFKLGRFQMQFYLAICRYYSSCGYYSRAGVKREFTVYTLTWSLKRGGINPRHISTPVSNSSNCCFFHADFKNHSESSEEVWDGFVF